MRSIQPGRYQLVWGIAVVGMAFHGTAAMLAANPYGFAHEEVALFLFVLVVCGVVGACVGVASSPLVLVCLRRKDLRVAVPVVYGPSLVIVVLFVVFGPRSMYWPLDAAVPAFLAVCVFSLVALGALPNRFSIHPSNLCPECGYDLRGNFEPGCPECGWRREGGR